MKKFIFFLVSFGVISTLHAFDYKVSGTAETFTKWGLNNQALNIQKGIAPTESFTTLFSQLNINADLGAGLEVGLGGAIGGLAFDSTANAPTTTNGGVGTPVQNSYFGVSWDKSSLQNYMVQNAFVQYNSSNVYLKLGRYEAGKVGTYFSGYNQGAEGYITFSAFKVWGFWSNRRAFAYNQWFNDFFRMHGQDSKGHNRQTYAFGVDATLGGFSASLFTYFVPTKFTAPGMSLSYDTNPQFDGNGVRTIIKANAIFPQKNANFNTPVRNWGTIESSTASLLVDIKTEVDNFSFGAGIYKNFGNANALIGSWGSPLNALLDIWTANAYEQGAALNDIVSKNAFTGFGFMGATHGALDWQILARGTNSPRSAESSLALILAYKIREDISVGGKIEGFIDTTKAGYNPIAGYYKVNDGMGGIDNTGGLAQKRTDDRSHIFFYIVHSF